MPLHRPAHLGARWGPKAGGHLLRRDQQPRGLWIVGADRELGDPVLQDTLVAGDPTWTGDGHLVYAVRASRDSGRTSLWSVPVDGGGPAALVEPGTPAGTSDAHPDWSPDGLLFSHAASFDTPGQAYVWDGESPARPLRTSTDVLWATWAPQGQEVAYVVRGEGRTATVWAGDVAKPVEGLTGQVGLPAWGSR